MNTSERQGNCFSSTPMLIPYDVEEFWEKIRGIIREEVGKALKSTPQSTTYHTAGLQQKPLYKIEEICEMFAVTKPTIYDWIKHGKLKPLKIRSRVFFLSQDLTNLIEGRESA